MRYSDFDLNFGTVLESGNFLDDLEKSLKF